MPSLQGCSKRSPLLLVGTSEGQPWSWLVLGDLSSVRTHGLMVKETAFEFLPLHTVTLLFPMAPETEIALLPGGLKTKTSTVPGAAMSAAEIATTS
ncbi:MAG: hypothetical protein DMG85_15010 [Acidobacteria bacterium]|nr:MAG: hypothetical protein DMG85_15010 [Acidobacteriota bacterium]